MEISEICICGGGSLGTVIAAVLAAGGVRVNLLTGHPDGWQTTIEATDPGGRAYRGRLNAVSASPREVVPTADALLLCLPGYMICDTLAAIRPHLSPTTLVGSVFSSTGFFFEAKRLLPVSTPLWGFQRVPYIARVRHYGSSASLLGYKSSLAVAIEGLDPADKEAFRLWLEQRFATPTKLLNNYLEASISNSNPLLHTSRLYTMFQSWQPGATYPDCPLFYRQWTLEASAWLIAMDSELFSLIDVLPVGKDFLLPILEYYESSDAPSLTNKLRSIQSFAEIESPMRRVGSGEWAPDFSSRYFTEDFQYGLRYIHLLARDHGVATPHIDATLGWWAHIQSLLRDGRQ